MKPLPVDAPAEREKKLEESLTRSSGNNAGKTFSKMLDEEAKSKDKDTPGEKNSLQEDPKDAKDKQEDSKSIAQVKVRETEREYSPLRRFLYEMVYRDPATWSIADRQFYRLASSPDGLSQVRKILSERPTRLVESPEAQVHAKGRQSLQREERSTGGFGSGMASQEQSSVHQDPFAHFRTSLDEIGKREGVRESRILDQVLQQISLRDIRNGSEVSMVLNPDALGEVRLLMTVQGNEVTAKFQTSNRRVGQVLKENLSELSRALAKQGLDVKALEVEKIN